MGEPAPAALLRIREADVVRLCGLAAAAEGSDLAGRRMIHTARREGVRITATIGSPIGRLDAAPLETWVEVAHDAEPGRVHWACTCGAGSPREPAPTLQTELGALACAHVAAVLTHWIHHAAEFSAADAVAGQPGAERAAAGVAAHQQADSADRPAVYPPTPFAQLSLRAELDRLSQAELDALARRVLGMDSSVPHDRSSVLDCLCDTLSDRKRLTALLERLDQVAGALLAAIGLLGGAVTGVELDGMARRAAIGRASFEAGVVALERHGMLFPIARSGHFAADEARRWRAFVGWSLPAEIREALGPAFPPLPVPWTSADGRLPLDTASRHAATPLRGARLRRGSIRPLCAAAALLAYSPVPVHPVRRKRGPVPRPLDSPASKTSRLPPLPGDPSAAALVAWARGAHVPVGLARMARRTLMWAREAQGDAYPLAALNRLPPMEWPLALRTGFLHWLAAESHAELADLTLEEQGVCARCDPAHPGFRPTALSTANATARRFVARVLAHLPIGSWLALADILNLVWWINPSFLRGQQRAWTSPSWWLEDAAGSLPTDWRVREEWQRGEGRYLTALLMGPFHWWGAVDLAHDTTSSLQAVRITATGAYLLGVTDEVPDDLARLPDGWGAAVLPTRTGPLAIQPLAAGPALLDALAPWTVATGVAGGRLIVAPSPDRMCRSLDAHLEPQAALDRLRNLDARDHTHAAPAFATLLDGWRARYGEARIESGLALIEAETEAILREILAAAPDVGERCRLLAPHVALVPWSVRTQLRQILSRQGYVV